MARQLGMGVGGWFGGLVAGLLLTVAGPALALQATTTTLPVTPSPIAGGPKTYTECVRAYAARPDAQATCARLFPATAPAASTSSTNPAPTSTDASTPTRTTEPVDITPQLNKLLEAWKNRPKTPPKPPADPLAVIPGIQAACADYAGAPERWRRCALDGWRTAGFTGQPPLVLQNPPVVAPPPVVQPPAPTPVRPPVVQSRPPIQTPPPLRQETVAPEPVTPAPVAVPEPPPAAIVPPEPGPPPAVVPAPPPKPPATPIWFWLAALIAAAGAGFGLAKLLSRARAPSSRPAKAGPAPCPGIALVADPGVVVLTPEGSPRAGLAVSLHFERADGDGAVTLDYPTLETTP